jgi:hypothetical protein
LALEDGIPVADATGRAATTSTNAANDIEIFLFIAISPPGGNSQRQNVADAWDVSLQLVHGQNAARG